MKPISNAQNLFGDIAPKLAQLTDDVLFGDVWAHTVGDHTSLLALIEKRFMSKKGSPVPHLTARDKHADTLEDMFDFVNSPSLNTTIGTAAPPATDCTPTNAAASTP